MFGVRRAAHERYIIARNRHLASLRLRSVRSDDGHSGVEEGEQEHEAAHKSAESNSYQGLQSRFALSLKYSTKFVTSSVIGKAPVHQFAFVFLENLTGTRLGRAVNNHLLAQMSTGLYGPYTSPEAWSNPLIGTSSLQSPLS